MTSLFEFTAVMGGNVLVNPKFSSNLVQLMMPTSSVEYCCCLRKGVTNTAIPRHNLLGFDFTSDEWNFGCLTCCMKFCCCLSDNKALSIMTSDVVPGPVPLPVFLNFYTDPKNSKTGFSKELPNQMKDYIFSPLNGISSNAQLISHMMKDGLVDKVQLDFKIGGKSAVEASPSQAALFEINSGTRGNGKFSEVKFFPSYVSMVYGNNGKCCMGMCKNPCMIQSHEQVKYDFFKRLLLSFYLFICLSVCLYIFIPGCSPVSSH